MSEDQAPESAKSPIRKVSLQERCVQSGPFTVINGSRVKRHLLKQRFAQGGYEVQETPHFLLLTRPQAPSPVLIHWFAPEEQQTAIWHCMIQELAPLGLITHPEHLAALEAGIQGGMHFRGEVCRAWNAVGATTLPQVLAFLRQANIFALPDTASLSAAAVLYQRVSELCVGERFLDVGCKSGFFSLLLAQPRPFIKEVVGVDRNEGAFAVGQALAAERHLSTVRFVQADLLADDFPTLGQFDTVTALHVLDHLAEADLSRALIHLLAVTAHRLVIAVPYGADSPDAASGHQQWFSRERLEAMGEWCLQHIQGAGRMWCEDLIGGLLLIERQFCS